MKNRNNSNKSRKSKNKDKNSLNNNNGNQKSDNYENNNSSRNKYLTPPEMTLTVSSTSSSHSTSTASTTMALRRPHLAAAARTTVSPGRGPLAVRMKNYRTQPTHSLRAYARLALISIRLCTLSFHSMEAVWRQHTRMVRMQEPISIGFKKNGLEFNPAYFRAKNRSRLLGQTYISMDTKRLLQKDARTRTENDINYLLTALKGIPAFAGYPTRMQRKFLQMAWFESYEPHRVILNEGDPPHSFYFILSGKVLVTRFEPQYNGICVLVTLLQGMSFGELAVIGDSKRQATVTSTTAVELLCVSSRDFKDIFMAGGRKIVTDPDHNSFVRMVSQHIGKLFALHHIDRALRTRVIPDRCLKAYAQFQCAGEVLKSVDFLKHWPIHRLAENPDACTFHFFNRGQVLVRDSNNSDWIYIVKSGSLSVLKKMPRIKPGKKTTAKDEENDSLTLGDGNLTSRSLPRSSRNSLLCRQETKSPEVFRNHLEADRRLEHSLPGVFNVKDRLGLVDYDRVISEYRARVQRKPSCQSPPLVLPSIIAPWHKTSSEESTGNPDISTIREPGKQSRRLAEEGETEMEEDGHDVEERKELSQPISKTSKGVYLAPAPSRRHQRRPAEPDDVRRTSQETDISQPESDCSTIPFEKMSPKSKLYNMNIAYQRKFREHVGRRTIADQLDAKGSHDFKFTEVDLDPMFVLAQVLEKGQYFGVSQLLFSDQPSMSLVSNGAELIVLSKRLFLDHASEACLRHLRHTECPFPTEDAMRTRLQDYVDWKAYRARVYNRLVTEIRQKQARRKQFLPRMPGCQYSFRSGPS